MEVILKRDWFGPDHTLYRKTEPGKTTKVPEEYTKQLPSDARVSKDGQTAQAETVAERLARRDRELGRNPKAEGQQLDAGRQAAEAEEKLLAEAAAAEEKRKKAEEFQRQLDAENAGEGEDNSVSRDTKPTTRRRNP